MAVAAKQEGCERILILGGTSEARTLAEKLHGEGHHVTTSLAGRTTDPALPVGETRIGGFGGWEAMAAYLVERQFTRVIDATHPFARRISENAIKASAKAGIPLQQIIRPRWQKMPGDRWKEVRTLEEAAEAIPGGATVFLALGRQHIDVFATRSDCRFVIRMVDEPESALPISDYALVIGKPASDPECEVNLLSAHGVTHIVARNSGGPAGYAKIIAARKLGLPVIILERS